MPPKKSASSKKRPAKSQDHPEQLSGDQLVSALKRAHADVEAANKRLQTVKNQAIKAMHESTVSAIDVLLRHTFKWFLAEEAITLKAAEARLTSVIDDINDATETGGYSIGRHGVAIAMTVAADGHEIGFSLHVSNMKEYNYVAVNLEKSSFRFFLDPERRPADQVNNGTGGSPFANLFAALLGSARCRRQLIFYLMFMTTVAGIDVEDPLRLPYFRLGETEDALRRCFSLSKDWDFAADAMKQFSAYHKEMQGKIKAEMERGKAAQRK